MNQAETRVARVPAPAAPPQGGAHGGPARERADLPHLDLRGLDPNTVDLLVALAIGADLEPALLGAVLDLDPARVHAAAQDARAQQLISAAGTVAAELAASLLADTPPLRLAELRSRFATAVLARGGPMLAHARALARTATVGADVAEVLLRGAGEAEDPALAAALYAEAHRAGAPQARVYAAMAHCRALLGELDVALRLADAALKDPAAADRNVAVGVAASVLASRGMLARSAQLYRWHAKVTGAPSPLAVPALLGTGDLAGARAAMVGPADAPNLSAVPSLSDGAETLIADGILATIDGVPAAALSQLTRAAVLLEAVAQRTLLPDTPAALAAVVAINCGEFAVAESVLRRAVAVGLGGEPGASRYRALQAWTAMQRGDLDSARALLAVRGPRSESLEPREELWAAAIEVGLARREGDLGALGIAWSRARQAIVRHPVDLYALHPLGELAVAAARLREQTWIAPHTDAAWALLEGLGSPPLWAAPMHWYAVQAAALAGHGARTHLAALDAARTPLADALAAGARTWLDVMAGRIEVAAVESAARGLHAVGYAWDASRLAGQAAVRTEDRAAMAALMSCARSLRPSATQAGAEPATTTTAAPAAAPAPAPADSSGVLSERELEVAALLITGMTYKEIGERLFISAKTVEHHVARMRQRLGASGRTDLFNRLRALLSS
ncbi:MAG: LuxR C-terminal-related transcriptional regulator [Sporichthyaceae bacterium]